MILAIVQASSVPEPSPRPPACGPAGGPTCVSSVTTGFQLYLSASCNLATSIYGPDKWTIITVLEAYISTLDLQVARTQTHTHTHPYTSSHAHTNRSTADTEEFVHPQLCRYTFHVYVYMCFCICICKCVHNKELRMMCLREPPHTQHTDLQIHTYMCVCIYIYTCLFVYAYAHTSVSPEDIFARASI